MRGVGRFVCRCLATNKRPAPCPYVSSMANLGHHLLPILAFSFPKTKPTTSRVDIDPSVAGCTTGSVCPGCPPQKDRVLSLYVGLFCSLLQPSGKYGTWEEQ